MNIDVANDLINSVKFHEGYSSIPYKDSRGIWTIWYGHNLEVNPDLQASNALHNDLIDATQQLFHFIPWVISLDDVRQSVMIEFTYNLGIGKVLEFKEMLKVLKDKDYKKASEEMLNSEWAKQVGKRAITMTKRMELGTY